MEIIHKSSGSSVIQYGMNASHYVLCFNYKIITTVTSVFSDKDKGENTFFFPSHTGALSPVSSQLLESETAGLSAFDTGGVARLPVS